MTKTDFLSVSLSKKEQFYGMGYLIFHVLFLPKILLFAARMLPIQLTNTHINLIYFSINLLAAVLILHRYMLAFFPISGKKLLDILSVAAAGFILYWILSTAVSYLVYYIQPNFTNQNDQAVTTMAESNYPLMFIGAVIFVPITEECFFRGVLFRGLYDRSPVAAWLVSICVFSAIHIIGHTASLTFLGMVLSFVQYLPAGLCLAASYRLTGSLLCPILIHAATNLVGMLALR